MLRNRSKIIFLLLYIVIFLSLIGCGSNVPVESQDIGQSLNQDSVQNLLETASPTESAVITQTPGESNDAATSNNTEATQPTTPTAEEVATGNQTDFTYSDKDAVYHEEKEAPSQVELNFKETSETVYATANVNIRSYYTTDEDNVIFVLAKGESIVRIGVSQEWSKVLFKDQTCYIRSSYLSFEKPVAEVTVMAPVTMVPEKEETKDTYEEDFVSNLEIAKDLSQLVVVIGNGGSDCKVSFHTKDSSGKWKQQFSIDGDNGTNGISYRKKEGDKKTPAGLFSFTLAFGIKADPGSVIPYRRITKYDYWVDDAESPYYNTWVNSLETSGSFVSEHLIDHNPSYNYAMNINYNPENTPGAGSGIFLHCYNGTGRTTGCIAIYEDYMKTLIKQLDSSAMILIVPDEADLENY